MSRWPVGIALGLALVVAVNIGMTWLAISDAPEVVPSYDAPGR